MAAAEPTPLLAAPFRLGTVRLSNRVALAPHSTHFADRVESEHLAAYDAERARGGVGLIVHEPVVVHPSSLSRAGKVWGFDEDNVTAYRRTTDERTRSCCSVPGWSWNRV